MCVRSKRDVVQSEHSRQQYTAHLHLSMTTVPLKVAQAAQWQTRVQLRSNDGVRYETNRQILINMRSVNQIMRYQLICSGFFANLFQVPRPLFKGGNVETDHTIPLNDHIGPDNGRSAVAAPPSTNDEDIDIDIPIKDLKLFADFMVLIDHFKRFIRSANLELDVHEAGILLPLIDKFDSDLMRAVLKSRLASLAKTQPWEVLHLACQQDDLDLARTAISNLTSALIHKASTITPIDKNIWTKL